MPLDALLFDIDGTLLDTNAAHVEAWQQTFADQGYRICRDRIEYEIGKGGDKLVPAILGRESDEKDGKALRKAQPEAFARIARKRGIKAFPGAMELLREARAQGLRTALVTSSKKSHLKIVEEAAGIELQGACDDLVTADDAGASKPAPDLVQVAVRKLKMSPAQCAMLGDTSYDMQAAQRAGVIGLGLLTGYEDRRTLVRNGARGVWKDVAEVRAQLPAVLTLASPTQIRLTAAVLAELMDAALAEARKGLELGEAPIGCVICDGEGRVVAGGYNQLNRLKDRTAHAEMVAFRSAAGKISIDRRDLILVSTLEPCVMCTGAAMESAIDTIVYGLRAPADSGTGRVQPPETPETQLPRIVGGIHAGQSRALFEKFLKIATTPSQREFTKQLLSLTKDQPKEPDGAAE